MEEDSDLLWKEFLNSIVVTNNQVPTNVIATTSANTDQCVTTALFEDDEGDDPDDPDYNLGKDLQNFDLDNDFNLDEYLDFFNDANFSEKINQVEESVFDGNNEHQQLTCEQMFVFQEQLKFHVQTLTQTWMLSTYCTSLNEVNSESKKMLHELNSLHNNRSDNSSSINDKIQTNFAEKALNLIQERENEIIESEKRFPFAMASETTRKIITLNRDIFCFDWAFPIKRFFINNQQTKNKFCLAEDFLIATALSEHPKSIRVHNHFCQKIQNKYMPFKTILSIASHIKHFKRSPNKSLLNAKEEKSEKTNFNPIAYFFNYNKLPCIVSCFLNPDFDTYSTFKRVPKWFSVMNSEKDDINDNEKSSSTQDDKTKTATIKKTRFIAPKYENVVLQTVSPSCISSTSQPYVPFTISSYPVLYQNVQNTSSKEVESNIESALETLQSHKLKTKRRNLKSKTSNFKNKKTRTLSKDIDKNDSEVCVSKNTSKSTESLHLKNNGSVACSPDKMKFINSKQLNNVIQNDVLETNSPVPKQIFESDILNDVDTDHEEFEIIQFANEDFIDDEEIDEEEFIPDEESESISADKIEEEMENEESKFDSRDDENDLMALMEASWTSVTNRSRQNHQVNESDNSINCVKSIMRKSDIVALQRNSSLFILKKALLFDKDSEENLNEWLIQYYFMKAQKIFAPQEYYQFLQLLSFLLRNKKNTPESCDTFTSSESLSNFTENKQNKVVYEKIKHFLTNLLSNYSNKNDRRIIDGIQELIELLVLFFDSQQAHFFGESFNYLYWKRVFNFLRKVELYLSFIYSKPSQQQSCFQKLIKSLNQISQPSRLKKIDDKVTKLKIKSLVSKVFNGNNLLIEEFSSLFLDDAPLRYHYSNSEDFDEFTLTKDYFTGESETILENVNITNDENDLKYGTSQCPCECHSLRNHTTTHSISSFKHCPSCAIRFIAGRIYLPHYNRCSKKIQLIEYVKSDENDNIKDNSNSKLETSINNTNCLSLQKLDQDELTKWTMDEDRTLLEACRSIILDFQITHLTDNVIESVAQQLVEQFKPNRSIKQLRERLRHLIEMLTASNKCSTSV